MIERAAEHSRPRYTLHIDGQLTAIVQTGDDDLGLRPCRGGPTARATAPHPKPVQALMTSPPQPRDIFLAAALWARQACVSSGALVCALAGAECPPAAGIGCVPPHLLTVQLAAQCDRPGPARQPTPAGARPRSRPSLALGCRCPCGSDGIFGPNTSPRRSRAGLRPKIRLSVSAGSSGLTAPPGRSQRQR